MLKITYLEDGIYLEQLQETVEAWKNDRILVSLRAAINIYVEASIACLVLPLDVFYLQGLAELKARELVEVTPCDEEYIEVSLSGTWIAQSQNSEEGVFVCELDQNSEYFLARLWQESQIGTSVISE
ncbi:MAG: hypothetical protein QNJ72_32405 [Pleurocapsa sp. MO_226.B13]|nr:hypothetical protein [Pleurocapsa sp. MO_226.B13]